MKHGEHFTDEIFLIQTFPIYGSIFGCLPYQFNRTSTFHFTRPFAHTNYMYHSFVASLILSWNNLPDSVKLFHSSYIYLALKGLCCIILRNKYISH